MEKDAELETVSDCDVAEPGVAPEPVPFLGWDSQALPMAAQGLETWSWTAGALPLCWTQWMDHCLSQFLSPSSDHFMVSQLHSPVFSPCTWGQGYR